MASSQNGHALDINDKAVGVKEKQLKLKRRNPIRWTVGLVVRLCIWYVLLTPFFRCPSRLSDLTGSSPRVCKPYLVVRSYVEPHIIPYYNTYGAPYVDTARPYVRVLNERVYTPAAHLTKRGYEKYGAPALDRAQTYGQQQWSSKVVPHIQSSRDKANVWYNAQVAPHVKCVTSTISPYYQRVHSAYWTALDGYILPFCARYQPFIGKTYSSGQGILTTRVMPFAQSTWSSAMYLVNNSLWPKISNLYSENVEPQLVKIGQRLASYREGSRIRTVIDDVDNSSEYLTTFAPPSVEVSKATSFTPSSSPDPTPTPSLSPAELAAQTREKIASDLEIWQRKFAVAAESGVEDLERRVKEIVGSYLASEVKANGESLATALEIAVEDQTSAVKSRINALAESLPFEEAPQEEETAAEKLLKAVRNAAISIRDRAHALRVWHISFEQELVQMVSAAVDSTLAVLDDVRDLGLQEIGMRWAWMDGVTYKDWEDYHALKGQMEDWKDKFRSVGLQHTAVEAAKALGEDTLSRGMDVAESAAKELARLKDVGRWKIAAREVSDDFDTRSSPPPPLPKPTPAEEEVTSGGDETTTSQPAPTENNPECDTENLAVETEHEPALGLDDEIVPDLDQDPLSPVKGEESSAPAPEPTEPSQASPTDHGTESETVPDLHQGTWGVAAAEVIADQDVVGDEFVPGQVHEDSEDIDNDIVDTEATKLADELLAQSLDVDEAADGGPEQPIASSPPALQPTPNEAVQDLLSDLLAGKDASYAEDILQKLNAIYELTKSASTPSPAPTDPVVDSPTLSSPQSPFSTSTSGQDESTSEDL
ncbi:hypothetical protein P175DRAFT_0518025 [Aspergillus ochraceoroseus IBT 24754]|uniref:Transcription factor hoxa13 n=2 Tax=Aspergillus ochraceoroseus TaxID=138278 RepID=A0A2T5LQM5_9EURO|nr:uncharacterized protein P175DRAFT_0518025 [Aspergillus ochraceoroseus IBT 24754]KKK25990.1 hypothetical protein AOCH_004115 [Aspergillus ochraceoroseus]PTU18566.1 hypothetical protein P175DRAFT_0518025 [Aspergillus ochraceoroseus IBT 24754]